MNGMGWTWMDCKSKNYSNITCTNDVFKIGDCIVMDYGTHSQTGLKYKVTGITADGYELSRQVTVKPSKPACNKKSYPVRNWWER